MAERFSLKDHLFNAETIGQLAGEFSALPGFDAEAFTQEVLSGFSERELLERLEWIADCLEPRLASDFPTMAEQLEAAMPERLDPSLRDDDFGHFIHAVPGILAVRHGLEAHRERALDLLEAATQRFSMEFYIRPFLNRWPEETMARLAVWAEHDNYHVRRLVSEGTRPRLPWAKNITIDPMAPLPFLEKLHADPARFVTRSVCNHLNDLSRVDAGRVMDVLEGWRARGQQDAKELTWMTTHALRTLIKQGDARAMEMLGFSAQAEVTVDRLEMIPPNPSIGDKVVVEIVLSAAVETPVLVDYAIGFLRPSGKVSDKVFKVKQGVVKPGKPLVLKKTQVFKGDATTYALVPGPHEVSLMVNGVVRDVLGFDLRGSRGNRFEAI
jgi:3-methyladenine DNA glycosylase AlkC